MIHCNLIARGAFLDALLPGRSARRLIHVFFYSVATALLIGCASHSRFHANIAPPGYLVLSQIRSFATREEILDLPTVVETLELSGIARSDIRDGMLADGRIFCCGGPNESDYSIWFLVVDGHDLAVGDIVEVLMGKRVFKGEPMQADPNRFIRRANRHNQLDGQCGWVPDNPALWARVLYCDGMEERGWIQQGGVMNVWIKPFSKE